MAKDKTEMKTEMKTETEVKTEVVDPTKRVTIEVSEEQKEAFAEFLAKQEILKAEKTAKELADKEPKTNFDVSLRFQHNINGKAYGPGRVRVPGVMLGKLMSQDQKAADRELSNMMGRERVYKLTSGMAPVCVKDTVSR